MHEKYVAEAAKHINFDFVPSKLYDPDTIGKNVEALSYQQEVECDPDDPRFFGYHVGRCHAHFRIAACTGLVELVITFEECTFEGFLHPDSRVIINMDTDADTNFRLTYDADTERLVLTRMEAIKPN